VDNVHHTNGGVGCVAKQSDGRWVIACPEPEAADLAFSTRADAAKAEELMVRMVRTRGASPRHPEADAALEHFLAKVTP
jgi:hypothetical protein